MRASSGVKFFGRFKRIANKTPWIFVLYICVVAIFLELLISSLGYISVQNKGFPVIDLPLDALTIQGSGKTTGSMIPIEEETVLTCLVNGKISSITMLTTDAAGSIKVAASFKDEGNLESFREYLAPALMHTQVPRSKMLIVHPMGEVQELQLKISPSSGTTELRGIVLNEAPKISFNFFRFLVTAVFFSLVYLIIIKKAYLLSFDHDNAVHNRLFCISVMLTICIVLFVAFSANFSREPQAAMAINPSINLSDTDNSILMPDGVPDDQRPLSPSSDFDSPIKENSSSEGSALINLLTNPNSKEIRKNDQYYQITHSWANGRIDIDIPVPQELENLSNPYDPSARADAGLTGVGYSDIGRERTFPIDYAYFGGKYYSYFGVAPAALTYYPVYKLTGNLLDNRIPPIAASILFVVMSALLFRRILSLWFKNVNLLLVLLGVPAITLTSNVLILVSNPLHFQTVQAFALLFCITMLYFGVRGLTEKRHSNIYLFLSGAALVLIVASRPNMSLYAFALIPLIICYLKSNRTYKNKLFGGLAVFVPVALGLATLLLYNYARFSSFLEFGANYQLTSSDIRWNSFHGASTLRLAIYHYLLQPMQTLSRFPFVTLSLTKLGYSVDQYVYAYPVSMGLLNYPIMASTTFFPFLLKRIEKAARHLLAMLGGIALLMAIMVFAKAGIDFRYSCDFAVFFALIGAITLIVFVRSFGSSDSDTKFAFAVASILMMVSILIAVFLSFSGDANLFFTKNPKLYIEASRFFDIFFY